MQWNYNQPDKTLTIRGEGPIRDYYWDDEIGPDTPWKDLDIVKLVIQEGITSIGYGIFNHLKDLEEVKIPSTVIEMNCPFIYCNKLKRVIIPSENHHFFIPRGNKYRFLTEGGVIMESSKSNEDYLFKVLPVGKEGENFRSLITTRVRQKAAYGIDSNFSIYIGPSEYNKNLVIERSAFEKSNITKIDLKSRTEDSDGGFSYLIDAKLTNVEIQDRAFYACKKLSKVNIDKITTIGNEAFFGCESLESISLTEATQYIGDRAFEGCTNLVVTIPGGTFVGTDAFKGVKEVIQQGNSEWNDF